MANVAKMNMMIPSSNQEAVYSAWTSTDSNLLLQAVAGSGKSTTLIGILERTPFRTLFLAFNKSIQEEMQSKINNKGLIQGKALTIHSLGLTSITQAYGRNVVVNKSKNWDLIKHLEKCNKRLYRNLIWEDKAKINITLIEMNDISRLFMTDDMDEIFEFMRNMDKFYYEHPDLLALWEEFKEIREATYSGIKKEIDFVDMIFLPVREKLYIPVAPVYLLIDEAQDLNLAQHLFIDLLLNQGDIQKWVAVGDRNQSIYGFSGAYGTSFDLFKQKENVIELPLGVCYRCPSLIIDEANKVYNVMEGFKEEEGIVDVVISSYDIQDGSMVICRNTDPLIKLYFQLISQKKKVFLKGEDILGGITRFLKPYLTKNVSDTKRKISDELKRLEGIQNKSDDERFKYFRLKQNFTNFALLITNLEIGNDKVEVVLQSLNKMFEEIHDDDAITLCTIHKSKGLEADVVYILDEYLIPSKFAKSPMQLEQEQNLKYVARTRAKQELYYLNLNKPEDESN